MKCKALFFYEKYSEIKMSSAAVAISTLSLPLLIYSVRNGFTTLQQDIYHLNELLWPKDFLWIIIVH